MPIKRDDEWLLAYLAGIGATVLGAFGWNFLAGVIGGVRDEDRRPSAASARSLAHRAGGGDRDAV